jgi:hypothetical protein
VYARSTARTLYSAQKREDLLLLAVALADAAALMPFLSHVVWNAQKPAHSPSPPHQRQPDACSCFLWRVRVDACWGVCVRGEEHDYHPLAFW